MPSPFPGMDPYLEGYLWPDVHHALATQIRRQLTPKLRPRYAARLEVYVVEDSFPESDIGILYPDVEVMQLQLSRSVPSTAAEEQSGAVKAPPAPLTIPIPQPVPVRLANVEIRDTAQNVLVTCIAILSPVNKREPGLTAYRQKRQGLYRAGVHLVELDLLRRGVRPFAHPQLPEVPYAIALTRSHDKVMGVWPLTLQDALPTIPIPLQSPDPDVPLDLSAVLQEVYDEAAYDLSLDYTAPPPPPVFSAKDKEWLETQFKR
ncbi:MAG: DUF4058 family protein [Leptolyngbyaceae cyanobacterium MO_188.B28]|nr:DUF4058 family protein [Leptolyngbyaceae cyanobacterium MO_188.B28]